MRLQVTRLFPGFLGDLTVKLGHTLGGRVDKAVRNRHRRHLRRAHWAHALDAPGLAFAEGTAPPRAGNTLEVLIDGSEALPRMAAEIAAATSHVHITGWFLSPELALSREEEPLVVRVLLAELAERIDVRVLLWKGAPIPAFRPSRADVREVEQALTRHSNIKSALDSRTGLSHCHHEKTIVIDDRVAFVGGIDLTLDGGDPYDTPNHRARGGIGWHDAAVRIEGPAVQDVAEHFRLRWQSAAGEAIPAPATARAGRRRGAPGRPHAARGLLPFRPRTATTRSWSRTSAPCARQRRSSISRTSSSGRRRSSRS